MHKKGKLTHELVEQHEKAFYGSGKGDDCYYKENHQTAIIAENHVNGSSRRDNSLGRGRYDQAYTDKSGLTTHYYFSTSDAIIEVRKGLK